MTIYMGLMSGTSMDGIDAALLDVETQRFVGGLTRPYDQAIKDQLLSLMAGERLPPVQLWQLHTLVGRQFSQAATALLTSLGISAQDVKAIGSHGQTIFHDAKAAIPYTIQLGCPHTIATETAITVVADFRTRDVVNGGQGAPLAPIYHQALFAQQHESLAVVNIGGIANVTFLSSSQPTYGYDSGPGNCLLDAWIYAQTGQSYDVMGQYAATGTAIPQLLAALLADPYFSLPYPKSSCKSYFSLAWLQSFLHPMYTPQDIQATLVALTADSIAHAILAASTPVKTVALCGGGVKNRLLYQRLQTVLGNIQVISTHDLGIPPDFLEAMMCGWLAHQTLIGNRLDLSQITGASKPAILGAIYPY